MRQLKISNSITNRESFSLEKYLVDISKISLLTTEQEIDLARRIRTGDRKAFDKLVSSNLRFVVSVAKQYQNQGLTLSDLITEGNIGLMKAAERFDETKGFKFISYAVWWVRQAIMQAILEHSRLVRVPLNKISSYNRINGARLEFIQKYEREPSTEELSEILSVKESDIYFTMRDASKHVSIDASLGNDNEDTTLLDTLSDATGETPESPVMRESLHDELIGELSHLDLRERQVITAFFGINETFPLSLEEIGTRYHMTTERARQIKEKALRRLRRSSDTVTALRQYLG